MKIPAIPYFQKGKGSGGNRPGSGRKGLGVPTITMTFKLPVSTAKKLALISAKKLKSKVQVVRDLIDCEPI